MLTLGLTATDAQATTTRTVCAEAAIINNPSVNAGKWGVGYCNMTQNGSSGWLELDYPLPIEGTITPPSPASSGLTALIPASASAGEGQLLTMYADGAFYSSDTELCAYSSPSYQTVSFNSVSLGTYASTAMIALWGQPGAVFNSIAWAY